MNQLMDEWKFITKDKFIWLILIVPMTVALVFGYIFSNNQVNEAPVAVVDIDHSNYSQQLINKLDASQYIRVNGVYKYAIDPNELLYKEKYVGVIYLPSGLEAARLQGKQTNIGFYVDMTVSAATSGLRSGVSEVINTENASFTLGRLKAMGFNDTQATGTTSNLSLQQRLLYNPTSDTMMSSVIGFVNTITLSLLGSATLSIVARLRSEEQLSAALENPLGLISRLVPYTITGAVSLYLIMGLLKQVGGLRFEANVIQIGIPFLLYIFSVGLMSMLIGWSAPTPEKAAGRSLLIILPAFLLSGAQSPIALLPVPLQWVSNIIPLSWHFRFLRGLGFRGGDLSYFIPELGGFLT